MTVLPAPAGGTDVAWSLTGGALGVRRQRVSVHRLLPRAGDHGGHPRADPAAAAQHGGGGALRQVLRGAAARAAQAHERRPRRRPQVPDPVPEGLPAPRARALQRAHRAADPGDAAERRPAQPRSAARRGAGAAHGRQGRQGQAPAARGGGRLPRRRRGQGRHRGGARHGRDRLRRRGADGAEPAGPAGRDRGHPHQARPAAAGNGRARVHRTARLRPGDARRDRAVEAEEERRPEGRAAARDADGCPGAAHARRR